MVWSPTSGVILNFRDKETSIIALQGVFKLFMRIWVVNHEVTRHKYHLWYQWRQPDSPCLHGEHSSTEKILIQARNIHSSTQKNNLTMNNNNCLQAKSSSWIHSHSRMPKNKPGMMNNSICLKAAFWVGSRQKVQDVKLETKPNHKYHISRRASIWACLGLRGQRFRNCPGMAQFPPTKKNEPSHWESNPKDFTHPPNLCLLEPGTMAIHYALLRGRTREVGKQLTDNFHRRIIFTIPRLLKNTVRLNQSSVKH